MEIWLGLRIQNTKFYIMKTLKQMSKGREYSQGQLSSNDYGGIHIWERMSLNTKRNLEFGS